MMLKYLNNVAYNLYLLINLSTSNTVQILSNNVFRDQYTGLYILKLILED